MAQNVVIDFRADTEGLRPAFEALLKIGKLTEEDVKAFDKATQAQKTLAGEAVKSASSFDKLASATQNVKKNIVDGSINKSIKGTADLIDKAEVSTKKYDSSIQGLKKQYKELLSLAIANGEKSPIGKQALKDAGELKDRIADLAQATKNYGSDTKTFDAIGQGIGTIGAGFQVATGAQALFGKGSEDLQKKLVQLQAIMAFTNGLQQIQSALQKETALRQGINAVATKASAIAQTLYSVAVGTSTGAMKLFRLALIGTGIGALVVGIIALIQNFDAIKESVTKFINKFEFLKQAIAPLIFAFEALKKVLNFGDNSVEQAEKTTKALDAISSKLESAKKRELALRASLNQNTFNLEKKATDAQLKLIETQNEQALLLFSKRYLEEGKLSEENSQKLTEKLTELNDKKLELQVRSNEIDNEGQKQALEASLKNTENKLRFIKKGSEEELSFRVAVNLATLNLEVANIRSTEEIESLKSAKIKEAQLKRKEADKQASQDFFSFQLNLKKQEIDNSLLITGTALESELSLKLKALNIDKEITLNNYKLTSEERLLIEQSFQNKRVELNKQYQDKINAELLKSINISFDKAVSEEKINQQRFNAESDYLIAVAELEANYTNNSLGKKIALEQAIRKVKIDTYEVEKSNIIALAELEQQRIDSFFANSEKKYKDEQEQATKTKSLKEKTDSEILAIDRETNLAILKDKKETISEELALLKERADLTTSFANLATDTLKQANDIDLQNKLDAFKKENEANELNFKNGNITEKQFFANKEALRKKEAKAKRDAAVQDRQIKIIETIINTASSIVKALPNIPLSILAGATGAIQLALINAQKIPEFAKGTKNAPKGWAWVGEQGPELISLKGGEQIKTATESKNFALSNASKNYTSDKTLGAKIDSSPVFSKQGKDAITMFQNESSLALDYSLLSGMISDGVGKQIGKMPLTQFTMDRQGFTVAVSDGNSKTNFLNDRYSSN